jgi:hypothetical protein
MMRWQLEIELSIEAEEIRQLRTHLKQMLQIVAVQMPGWAFLYRYEVAIASEDLNRQIRQVWSDRDSKMIVFTDQHSSTTQAVSVEEWKQFGQLIEAEVNKHSRVPCRVQLVSDLTHRSF